MFKFFVSGFVLAAVIFYSLATLPSLLVGGFGLLLSLAIIVALFWFLKTKQIQYQFQKPFSSKSINISAGIIIGFSWVFWQNFFTPSIPLQALNQHVLLEAEVLERDLSDFATEDDKQRGRIKYLLRLNSIRLLNPELSSTSWLYHSWNAPRIELSIYRFPQVKGSEKIPSVGERWLLAAKLRSSYSSQNPFSRDYESYLFQNRIAARGYLPHYAEAKIDKVNTAAEHFLADKTHLQNQLNGFYAVKLADAQTSNWRLWRDNVESRLAGIFAEQSMWRIYRALLIGDRGLMTTQDWQLLQDTGTIHLMAISGLHMGIAALLGALLFKGLWWLGVYRIERVILPIWMAVGALLTASIYLLFSGMGIPAQRAWIMISSVLLFVILQRRFQPWSALAIALFAVVIWDSRSVLSPGLWLSFMAVAIIFTVLPLIKGRAKWQQLLIIQLALTIGLAPLLIWQFQQVPTVAILANLLAVPLVSLIALPLLFVIAIAGLVSTQLSHLLLPLNSWLWQKLWDYLQWLQQWQASFGWFPLFDNQSVWWLLSVYLALFVVFKSVAALLTKRVNTSVIKWSAITVLSIGLSVSLWQTHPQPTEGELELTIFDVGQGQAISLKTQHHLLLYDAGPKWGRASAAQFSVIPFLQHQSQALDKLVISHSDIDHAGGLDSILQSLEVKQVISSQLAQLTPLQNYPEISTEVCQNGQVWYWDKVKFEFLAPDLPVLNSKGISDNDLSCVLKVSTQNASILIPGDLSEAGERKLLQLFPDSQLQADILIAGHHGSRYSSSFQWLKTIRPHSVIFSSGYQNRFDFPNNEVLQRLQKLPIQQPLKLYNTACSGAMQFDLTLNGIEEHFQTRKQRAKWYYQRCKQIIK